MSAPDDYFSAGGGVATLEGIPEKEQEVSEEQLTGSADHPHWLQEALGVAGKATSFRLSYNLQG